jgi:hypothetical protein
MYAGGSDSQKEGSSSGFEESEGEGADEGGSDGSSSMDSENEGEEDEEDDARRPSTSGRNSSQQQEQQQQRQHLASGHVAASFMAGDKGDSFARAFAKIMTKKVKPAKGGAAAGEEAAIAVAGDIGAVKALSVKGGGLEAVAPILAASSSLAKRKAEEAADEEARREQKRKRLEMKKRGHRVSGLVGMTGASAVLSMNGNHKKYVTMFAVTQHLLFELIFVSKKIDFCLCILNGKCR